MDLDDYRMDIQHCFVCKIFVPFISKTVTCEHLYRFLAKIVWAKHVCVCAQVEARAPSFHLFSYYRHCFSFVFAPPNSAHYPPFLQIQDVSHTSGVPWLMVLLVQMRKCFNFYSTLSKNWRLDAWLGFFQHGVFFFDSGITWLGGLPDMQRRILDDVGV